MIIAGTGHRPNKLGGYKKYNTHILPRLIELAIAALKKYQPNKVISGMAQGWDMALAEAAINLNIPLTAALPCEGQDSLWPLQAKNYYKNLLSKATTIHMCGVGGPYEVWKMQSRNVWMVDNCDLLLALWDGSNGGTGNCVIYARKVERPIVNLWHSWEKYNGCKKT